MKPLLTLLAAVLVVGMGSGCSGDTYESLAAESLTVMKQFATTLDGIKDAATAKAAKPQLKSILARMKSINERQAKLGTPTEAQTKAVLEKHGKEMEEVQMKIMPSMMRIGFSAEIQKELADLEEDFKVVDK